jgi:hypothetical protein
VGEPGAEGKPLGGFCPDRARHVKRAVL